MRSLSLVLLLLLALSIAQALPLQGGSDAVKCTLFSLIKTPVSQDKNNTQASLELDVGLLGARNATYELVDSKDNSYKPSLYRSLQPGRTLLVFAVPETALFKLMKVTPTEGKPFAVNWWKTPKGIKGDVIIRYYGVVDWVTQSDQQAVAYEIGIANNGTSTLAVSPENFTLLDQWGWPYYTMEGFTATQIEAQKAIKVPLVFGGISPFSRPSMIAYDYATDNQIIIDLDKDMGQLTDAQVYGTAAAQTTQPQNTQSAKTAAAQTTMKPASLVTPIKPEIPTQSPSVTQMQQTMMKPTSLVTPIEPQIPTQGPSVAQMQTSAAPVKQASSQTNQQTNQQATSQDTATKNQTSNQTANQTAKAQALSLKDQINASKQRLSGLKSGLSGGESTVGKKISASVEETRERLEKVKQGLKTNSSNNSTSNSTSNLTQSK